MNWIGWGKDSLSNFLEQEIQPWTAPADPPNTLLYSSAIIVGVSEALWSALYWSVVKAARCAFIWADCCSIKVIQADWSFIERTTSKILKDFFYCVRWKVSIEIKQLWFYSDVASSCGNFNNPKITVWLLNIDVSVSPPLSRLDYSGIALLIMGSFVPWLYYSFYCSPQPRLIYLTIVCVLGIAAIIVAQWDRFSTPRHRPTRAGTYQFRIMCLFLNTLFVTFAAVIFGL